ncbi:hypothetical protein Hte_003748 [Hypoxylon texense]
MSPMFSVSSTTKSSTSYTHRKKVIRRNLDGQTESSDMETIRDSFEVHRKSLARKKEELMNEWYADQDYMKAHSTKLSKGLSLLDRLLSRLRGVWTSARRSRKSRPQSLDFELRDYDQEDRRSESRESVYVNFSDAQEQQQSDSACHTST